MASERSNFCLPAYLVEDLVSNEASVRHQYLSNRWEVVELAAQQLVEGEREAHVLGPIIWVCAGAEYRPAVVAMLPDLLHGDNALVLHIQHEPEAARLTIPHLLQVFPQNQEDDLSEWRKYVMMRPAFTDQMSQRGILRSKTVCTRRRLAVQKEAMRSKIGSRWDL
uniref:Uncharacterized protein n=2 Tax=Leersia perrieri TaxID=77586 RepID=A0A0D9XU85_9ORYZ